MGESSTRPEDAVETMHIQLYRLMDSARKMRMLFEMFEFAMHQARLGARHRHPDWSDEQVEAEARRLVTGVELIRQRE
jgi:hypothetical protein